MVFIEAAPSMTADKPCPSCGHESPSLLDGKSERHAQQKTSMAKPMEPAECAAIADEKMDARQNLKLPDEKAVLEADDISCKPQKDRDTVHLQVRSRVSSPEPPIHVKNGLRAQVLDHYSLYPVSRDRFPVAAIVTDCLN